MSTKKFDIQNVRVGAPCPVSWDSMNGNDRVRDCASCSQAVYNTADMTEREVAELIHTREGRLCIRLVRRADGLVMTRDCPIGLKAIRKRVAAVAGSILAAVLSLFSISYGQDGSGKSHKQIVRTERVDAKETPSLSGTVKDMNGAVIPGATVKIFHEGTLKPIELTTDKDGIFRVGEPPLGLIRVEISGGGFKKYVLQNIAIRADQSVIVSASLEVSGESVTVGIFSGEPALIDMGSSTVKHTIILNRPPFN